MKKLAFLVTLFFLSIGTMMAQTTVSGVITDDSGEPLIGANVLAKGTTTGTITDIDGRYTITLPEGVSTLVLSYVGYTDKEMDVTGPGEMNISMSNDSELLSEIVVTGLGIKKDKKALGYAVTTLGSADVQLRPEADIGRILRGKVPGVDITSTSGLAGSGTNVIIRGYSSITGNNQPLFVVDGVPFNSDTNSDRDFDSGGATASSRFLDLDPNQIAEISVLKGLSATVLYGEAGRNGVVLVTTKNGDIGDLDKKTEVSVSQSVFVTEVSGVPETQQAYGNGWQNDASNAFSNWGAPFDVGTHVNGITNGGSYQLASDGTIVHPYSLTNFASAFPELADVRIPWEWQDNLNEFFGQGLVNQTSLNISNKLSEGTSINMSYGFMRDEGYVPNNNLNRHNFGLGLNSKLSNGLEVGGTFNFVTSERNTPPAAPIYSSNPIDGASLFSNVLYTPVSHDLFGWPYINAADGFSSVYYRSNNSIQHPRWTSDNINDNEQLRRFFGNLNFKYNFTDRLYATYRVGIDTYAQNQKFIINKGGTQIPDGALTTSSRLNFITDQTANLHYDFNISEDFTLDGIAGINLRREDRDRTFTNSQNQFVYGLETHDNFINHVNNSFTRSENTIGAYATLSAGYKNFLYVNVQGRNDWTSTLELDNRSVFYPSASIAVIPTEIISGLQNSSTVNYLKIRLGVGTSAGYPDPYQTRNFLGSFTNRFQTAGGIAINTNTVDNRFGNPDLAPERHREIEFGIEGRFLQNRIGLDLSLYDKQSSDLIIDLDLDPSTGFTNSTINAAKLQNRGVEIGLNLTPIATNDFQWSLTTNYTKNVSEVLSIADTDGDGEEDIDKVLIPGGLSFLGNFAIPGEQYGVIEGSRILRTEDGTPILGGDGLYQQDPEQGIIGDPNPDFNMNFINTLTFKGVSLRFQFDWVQGGDIWASTASTLTSRGIAGETGFDRFVPVIVPGVLEQTDEAGNTVYVPNNIQVTANEHYWRDAGVWFDENRMIDATTVRLREIALSFSLPRNLLEKTPFGGAALTFSGQNLWYNAVNFPDSVNFDPEVLSLGVGNSRGFDFVTGPTSKKYGATLNFTF